MYYRHSNKTAILSQNMIADALFRLLKDKPLQSISVTELCNRAAVGRKTFYRNFDLKEDVIDYKLDLLYKDFTEKLQGKTSDEQLRIYFEFIKENSEIFIILYKNDLSELVNIKFRTMLPYTMPEWTDDSIKQQYISQYIIAGIEGILRIWVERNFVESVDDVVALVLELHSPLCAL